MRRAAEALPRVPTTSNFVTKARNPFARQFRNYAFGFFRQWSWKASTFGIEKFLSGVQGNYNFGRIGFPYYGDNDEESSKYLNAISKLRQEKLLSTRKRLTENLDKQKNPIVLGSTLEISSMFKFPVALQTPIKWNSESFKNIPLILSQSTSSRPPRAI